jgi:hypothetical protein
MYKIIKSLHFVGLTLFLGSIWVFIVQGTPMSSIAITNYVRLEIVTLIKILTIPGLVIMILTGIAMVITRPALLKTTFFKVKIIIPMIILFNANYILHIAKESARIVQYLPNSQPLLETLLMRESIIGAVNVLLALFLIVYSIMAKKILITKQNQK